MSFFYEYPFLVPFIAALIAEVLKIVVDSVKMRKLLIKNFLHSGGMPSGHSALVGGLLVSVLTISGYRSTEFAMTLVVTFVVIYDALNIRRQAGQHAAVLNTLQKEKLLDERLGHDIYQIVVGLVLGIVVGWGLMIF